MVCRVEGLFSLLLFLGLSRLALEAASLDPIAAQNQAKRLYERLTGLPPNATQLNELTALMLDGRADQVAFRAMDETSSYGFYKWVLRNLFNPLSSRAAQTDLSLNDYTATIAGTVIQNKSFDRLLYADTLYVGDDRLVAGNTGAELLIRPDNNTPPAGQVRALLRQDNADVKYDDNNHYLDLQKLNDWPSRLVEKSQVAVYTQTTSGKVSAEDVAGLLTTRQWASEFYLAGTNRRSFRFLMKSFVCRDMEELMDISLPDVRVRQDVDRSPGGDSRTYLTRCAGCHTGMDGFAGAFAYFDFTNNQLTYNSRLQSGNKQFRQSNVFPTGYRLTDNSWINLWLTGANSSLGWRLPLGASSPSMLQGDRGAKALGMMVAASEAFSDCMVRRVFQRVCAKQASASELANLSKIARDFEAGFSSYQNHSAANPYNMRGLFARVSNICFGHE